MKLGETELIFSSGGSAKVEDKGIVSEGDTFVALDLMERKHMSQARAQLWVRSLCPIKPEWLFDVEPVGVEEKEELLWDKDRGRVFSVSRMVYGQLVLAETHFDVVHSTRKVVNQPVGNVRHLLFYGQGNSGHDPSNSATTTDVKPLSHPGKQGWQGQKR